MRKAETVNSFQQGLMMDLNPLVTPNNVVVNALNATLVTKNGNEYVLQNDMGNGRVETAYLPEGYIPMGITELGGIVYVVSYNPLIKKCQIGSFPSPERNITTDELGDQVKTLSSEDFVESNKIRNVIVKIGLSKESLHPGDKFIVGGNLLSNNINQISNLANPIGNVRLSLATLDSNGRLITLDTRNKYKIGEQQIDYFIYDGQITSGIDVDQNKNIVESPFQIFSSKIAGNLYLVAELEVIDTFSVTYKCVEVNNNKYTLEFTIETTPENIYIEYAKFDNWNNIQLSEPIYFQRDKQLENEVPKETTTLTAQLEISPQDTNKVSSFSITPCMSFGEYDQLSTTMYVNFSLLGTGTIDNNLWRYFKEPEDIYLVWNLSVYPRDNQKVVSVALLAYEFNEDSFESIVESSKTKADQDDHTIVYMTNRSSYSGSYSNIIEFSDKLKENTLYFIRIRVEFEEVVSGETIYTYKYENRILYTNGIFNNEYLQNTNEYNFDNLNPVLVYKPQFEQSGSVSTDTRTINQNLISPNSIGTNGLVRGADIITYNGVIKLLGTVALENNYNSFSTNNDGLSIQVLNYQQQGYRNAEIVSTSEYFQDSDYIHIDDFGESTTPTEDYLSMKDSFQISVVPENQNINLTINGVVYNKISANSINKQINISNFIAPIVYDQETAANCGLSVEGGIFTFGSSLYNLAITNGGGDNDGTGGSSVYFGRRPVTYNSDQLGFGPPVVYMSHSAENNDTMTNHDLRILGEEMLQSKNIPYSIVPIIWTNLGNKKAVFFKPDSSYKYNEDYLWLGKQGSVDLSRVPIYLEEHDVAFANITGANATDELNESFNKSASGLNFILVQLWMKTSQDDALYPTDTWIPIRTANGFISSFIITTEPMYLGNVVGSLLCQLYVKRTNKALNGYVVNDIEYYKRLQENWEVNINYTINGLTTPRDNLKFNNVPLSTIQDKYLEFDQTTKNCLYPETSVSTDPYKYTYHVDLGNPTLLEEYSRISSNSTLDTYVLSLTGTVDSPSFELNQSEVYPVVNGKLSDGKTLNAELIASATLNNGNLHISLGMPSSLGSANLLENIPRETFSWDYRNQQLVLSNSIVQRAEDQTIGFGALKGAGTSSLAGSLIFGDGWTPAQTLPSIKILNNFNIFT